MKDKRITFLIVFLCIFVLQPTIIKLDAQQKKVVPSDPNPLYNYKSETFGGSSSDSFTDVIQTSDSGFLITGNTSSNDGDIVDANNGSVDGMLLKLNKNLEVEWEQIFGGTDTDVFQKSIELTDGSFISVGYSNSGRDGELTDPNSPQGSHDTLIVKFDENGNHLWDKSIGGNKVDLFNDVLLLDDGNVLAVGGRQGSSSEIISSPNGYGRNAFIAKFDVNTGDVLWDKSIGTYAELYSAVQLENGNVLAVGYADTGGEITDSSQGRKDGLAMIIDKDGNLIDHKLYGSSGDDLFNTVFEDKDGNILVGGDIVSGDGDITDSSVYKDSIIFKYNNVTKQISSKIYDNFGTTAETLQNITQNKDGTYSLVITEATNTRRSLVLTLTNDGSIKYRNNLENDNIARDIVNYDENKYLVVGYEKVGSVNDGIISINDFVPKLSVQESEKTIHVNNTQTDDDLISLFKASATDVEEGDISTLITVDQSTVDYTTPGEYDITFNVKDSSGASSMGSSGWFYNVDSKKVKLKIINDKPILKVDDEKSSPIDKYLGAPDLMKLFNVSATDKEDGDITSRVIIDASKVEYDKEGDYNIIFSVSDSSGEVVSKTVVLHITNEKPIIKIDDEKDSSIGKVTSDDDLKTLFNVSATDEEDGDITSKVTIDSSSIVWDKEGDYKITFKVVDSSNNEVTKTAILHITNEKPILKADKEHEVNIGKEMTDDQLMSLFNVSATDKEDGDLTTNVIIDSSAVDFNSEAVYDIFLSVTDSDGNIAKETVEIKVIENSSTDKDDSDLIPMKPVDKNDGNSNLSKTGSNVLITSLVALICISLFKKAIKL